MLGGSFWIAFLRTGMGAALMMAVFLLLDRPRFQMAKAVRCYVGYWLLVSVAFSIWYLIDSGIYIRFAGLVAIPVIGCFCVPMSGEGGYLSLYKLALGFYLQSVTVFCGVDGARIWFDGNKWVDLFIRTALAGLILFVIVKYVRERFLAGVDFLRESIDFSSAVIVTVFILWAAVMAYWPDNHDLSVQRAVRIAIFLLMAGVIQWLAFRMYLYQGKEHYCQMEKELLEMNEQMLGCQIEEMREAEEEAARMRHDIRHHCLLIEEYLRNGQTEEVLAYVRQYREDIEETKKESICENIAINSILTVYARHAGEKHIQVVMQVKVPEHIPVRDIDMVAILANVFENAIHGCVFTDAAVPQINLSVVQKKNKLVIQCRNTCAPQIQFKTGLSGIKAKGGTGVASVMKVVQYYNGEADFSAEHGMFSARILLNIPAGS